MNSNLNLLETYKFKNIKNLNINDINKNINKNNIKKSLNKSI